MVELLVETNRLIPYAIHPIDKQPVRVKKSMNDIQIMPALTVTWKNLEHLSLSMSQLHLARCLNLEHLSPITIYDLVDRGGPHMGTTGL